MTNNPEKWIIDQLPPEGARVEFLMASGVIPGRSRTFQCTVKRMRLVPPPGHGVEVGLEPDFPADHPWSVVGWRYLSNSAVSILKAIAASPTRAIADDDPK